MGGFDVTRFVRQVEQRIAAVLQHSAQKDGPLLLKQLHHKGAGREAGAMASAVSVDTLVALTLSDRHHFSDVLF